MLQRIDDYIDGQPEWQAENLRAFRALVHEVIPAIAEDWKWDVPVFVYDGTIVFAMSVFKGHTKFNFLTGATLPDQSLFNSGLDSKRHRSINLAYGEPVDGAGVKRLIRDAITVHG